MEDDEFDTQDISNLLKDIDSANAALDALDGRANALTASLASLLRAQSLPSPYAEATPAEVTDANGSAIGTSTNASANSNNVNGSSTVVNGTSTQGAPTANGHSSNEDNNA